jgi:hypothetical protein
LRSIADLMPQESDQVVRLLEGIRANFRRAIARAEPRAFSADIEPSDRYPFPAQAAGCRQTRLVHSQYKSADPGLESFSILSRMHEHRTSPFGRSRRSSPESYSCRTARRAGVAWSGWVGPIAVEPAPEELRSCIKHVRVLGTNRAIEAAPPSRGCASACFFPSGVSKHAAH